ncbi:MAG: YfhO family protein, partial [Candidatus Hydrogenedentes bacterium]|nr:YfhO family protein [Candidatus Hydrogenedentota bacterium]
MGVPLIGVYQTAVFYPPRLLFLLLDDLYVAFTLFILSKLWLAGMFAYGCARSMALPPAYARFFSIAYMLGGYLITWCSYTTVDSMAWAPLLFVGMEALVQGRWRRGYALCLVSSTMMVLAAGAQHTLTFALLLSAYFVVRLAGLRRPSHALYALAFAGGAAVTALGVTAIQVFPFLDTLRLSVSALDPVLEDSTRNYYLSPFDVPVLWTPAYFGTYLHGNYWGRMNALYAMMGYVGVPCWLGASLAFRGQGYAPWVRARVRSLLAVALVALWLVFDMPGTAVVLSLPGFDKVRSIYFLSFFIFAVPLAVAFALERWFTSPAQFRPFVPALAAACAIVAVTAIHFTLSRPEMDAADRAMKQNGTLIKELVVDGKAGLPLEPMNGPLPQFVWEQAQRTLGLLALSLAGLALAFAPRYRRAGVYAVTGVLLIDLLSAWQGMQPTSPRRHVFPQIPVLDDLAKRGHPYRVSFFAVTACALSAVYDIEEADGYDTILPRRYAEVAIRGVTLAGRAALEPALAIPCYLFPAPRTGTPTVPPGFEVEFVRDGVIVARHTRVLPRARLVGAVEKFETLEAMLERINGPGFDPAHVALIDGPNAPAPRSAPDGPLGEARVTRWSWNEVDVEVDAAQDAVLVLAESYSPGWEAQL